MGSMEMRRDVVLAVFEEGSVGAGCRRFMTSRAARAPLERQAVSDAPPDRLRRHRKRRSPTEHFVCQSWHLSYDHSPPLRCEKSHLASKRTIKLARDVVVGVGPIFSPVNTHDTPCQDRRLAGGRRRSRGFSSYTVEAVNREPMYRVWDTMAVSNSKLIGGRNSRFSCKGGMVVWRHGARTESENESVVKHLDICVMMPGSLRKCESGERDDIGELGNGNSDCLNTSCQPLAFHLGLQALRYRLMFCI